MKIARLIRFLIYLAGAVLLAIFHRYTVHHIKYIVPVVMLLYGLEAIVTSIFINKNAFYSQQEFYWGITEIVLATLIMAAIGDFVVICVIWAVWSILRETDEIKVAVIEFKKYTITSIISTLESLANMALSIFLIISPTTAHATTHLYLLIVELVIAGALPLIRYYIYTNREKVEQS